MSEKKAKKLLMQRGMSNSEAKDFLDGVKRGLAARRLGKVKLWSEVKKELGLFEESE